MKFKWKDFREIAILWEEKFPDQDNINLRFTDLHKWIVEMDEFDDDPEITSYLQVRDLNNKDNNEVFVFNGWSFSSSPSIQVFDHPVYDL